jgi:diphthine synthase
MLILVGLGLWDEKDITLKGIERAKSADIVYLEIYTSKWHGDIKGLEKIIGKKIISVKRKDLEENSNKILDEAKNKKIVLFVFGDPLVATTHTSLLLDAKKKNIDVEIIHNASIYSAVCETGLHMYRFGATVTIPFPEKTSNKIPRSIYETIIGNKKKGLHSLLLLDIIYEKNKFLTPNEGMEILIETEKIMKKNVFTMDTEVVVLARAGSDKSLIVFGKVKDLINKNFGEPPFVMILPGNLHFTEKDYLKQYEVNR